MNLIFCIIALAPLQLNADWPQWRGAGRVGHSPDTSILAPWPKSVQLPKEIHLTAVMTAAGMPETARGAPALVDPAVNYLDQT